MKTIKVPSYIAEKLNRKPKDFRIDFFCTGGPGGQNQNKRKNGVRITDLITGISAEGRDQKEQAQNKSNAFLRLVDKLIVHYKQEWSDAQIVDNEPKTAIRTYNLCRNVVKDKRVNEEFRCTDILNGKLDALLEGIMNNASNG